MTQTMITVPIRFFDGDSYTLQAPRPKTKPSLNPRIKVRSSKPTERPTTSSS